MKSTTCPPYDLHQWRAKEFRAAYELPTGLTTTSLKLQRTLIDEECNEVSDAVDEVLTNLNNKRARENLLKELADLVYVCYQMAAAFDWNLTEASIRVHDSNMSKLDDDGKPIRREDGKILKGDNYIPPTLIDLV